MSEFTSQRQLVLIAFCGSLLAAAAATADAPTAPAPPKPHLVCFEAEHANEVTPIVHVVRAKGASGGMAVTVPEGGGSRRPTGDQGHATYHLHIPADGLYYTWFRVWWQGTCSNSLFCSLHPALPRFSVMGNVFKKWNWVHGPMADLKTGPAVMKISYREDGIWVDQVLLTTQAGANPKGIFETNTIPTPPENREMTLSLSSRAVACDSLTAPRLRVTSHVDRTASIPADQAVVLIPGKNTDLTVWLRNNPLTPATGTVSFLTKAKMSVEPTASRHYAMGKDEPIAAIDFRLLPPADMPRRSHRAVIRAVLPSGRVEARRLNLLCPLKWLCSEAYPFDVRNGLDTPYPIEKAANPLDAGKWHVAPDSCTTPIGLLNMRKAVTKKDYVLAYAYTEVRPPHPGKYLLHTANDDMMKVWVNGKMVHREDSEQPTSATRALTEVELVEGRNRILVKSCQKRNFWEFLLEVRNPDGSPSEVEGCDVQPPRRSAPK